jgi:hypothetical protein
MRTTQNDGHRQPAAKVCQFELNPSNGWYQMTGCPPGFTKVPPELRVEDVIRADIAKTAQTIIRGRKEKGRYLFFTGLLPTQFPGLSFGDYFKVHNGNKKNSFCLFWFSDGNQNLEVHFFNEFKVYPNRRAAFIADYWNGQK